MSTFIDGEPLKAGLLLRSSTVVTKCSEQPTLLGSSGNALYCPMTYTVLKLLKGHVFKQNLIIYSYKSFHPSGANLLYFVETTIQSNLTV